MDRALIQRSRHWDENMTRIAMYVSATTASCERSHQTPASFGTSSIMTSARTDDIRDALVPSDRSRVGWDRFVGPEGGLTISNGPPSLAPPATSASKACCNALSGKPGNVGLEDEALKDGQEFEEGGWKEH